MSEVVATTTDLPIGWWLVAFLLGCISGGIEMLIWHQREWSSGTVAIFAIYMLLFLGMTYLITANLVRTPPMVDGFVRFVVTIFLSFSPFLAMAGWFVAIRDPSEEMTSFTAIFLLASLLLGLVSTIFLPAWPVAQALSTRLVSPVRMLRATKGHRWQLIICLIVFTSINGFVPDILEANTLFEASLIAAGDALLMTVTTVFLAAMGVTAWTFAKRNDPSLG